MTVEQRKQTRAIVISRAERVVLAQERARTQPGLDFDDRSQKLF